MGILSVLSKKKKEGPVILSAETLIPELLGQNLKKINGNTPDVELVQIKFTNWQIYLTGQDSGHVLRFFRNSTRSPLSIFFPSEFISKYIPAETEKELQSKLVKLLGLLPAYLMSEIKPGVEAVRDDGEQSSLPDFICSELKGRDEVLWQTSGSKIFNIRFGTEFIYIFLAEDEAQKFNRLCRDSEITFDLIQNLTQNSPSINRDETLEFKDNIVSNEISNQSEFLLGRFFLPRTILVGEHNAVSGFDKIDFEPEQLMEEGGVNFVLNITIDEKTYSIDYFIPAKDESKASVSRIMQYLIKAVLPMWRRFFEIRKVGGMQGGTGGGKVLLSGGIKYQNNQIPIKISIPEDIVSLFSNRFLKSEEFINSDLSRIISLNQELLLVFFKDNLFPPMTLPEFFNLIDDFDLRRIIQNYFSGTGWNSESMQPLFTYSKKVIEKNKIYYFYDPHFNRSRFFSFLPKSQKDEWKRTRGASESREEMISTGRKALREIYNAYRSDHLDLSFKSSILLRNEFKIRGESEIRKNLDGLMQREPFSLLLENKYARDVQNLLARLTAKVLANALVLYTNNLGSLEPFMSRNYRAEVKDLIKIVQRKSAADGFEMEKIRTDLLALHNGLKDLPEEEMI